MSEENYLQKMLRGMEQDMSLQDIERGIHRLKLKASALISGSASVEIDQEQDRLNSFLRELLSLEERLHKLRGDMEADK